MWLLNLDNNKLITQKDLKIKAPDKIKFLWDFGSWNVTFTAQTQYLQVFLQNSYAILKEYCWNHDLKYLLKSSKRTHRMWPPESTVK